VLPFGQPYDQTIEIVPHDDLAREPRHRLGSRREVQHLGFHRLRRRQLIEPGRIDEYMAGRARALAAAIGIDARNAVADRPLHHGFTNRNIDDVRLATVLDVSHFGHGSPCRL